MRVHRFVITVVLALFATAAQAVLAQESILYSFGQFSDGRNPASAPLFDAAGNMYGTAASGGLPGEPYFNTNGIVWELTPAAGGTWTETVLYNFGTVSGDGASPNGSLIFDAAGNLYGTVTGGGAHGEGAVFELTPGKSAGGAWTEKILYSFQAGTTDGGAPQNVTLVRDSKGNLYGTTQYWGAYGSSLTGGTVFELSPQTDGTWKEQMIYSFGSGNDGAVPVSGVTMDAAGNLYGTTEFGGTHGDGTVYELSPASGGTWKEKVLHNFYLDATNGATDGAYPYDPVILDSSGNLYGTTKNGGANPTYLGIVFELSPSASGEWTLNVLHTFTGDPFGTAPVPDGDYPQGGLMFDAAGNLYGTTTGGGTGGQGGVFVMTPGPNGWSEKLLYSFAAALSDGHVPYAAVGFDAAGNLYGTTSGGGSNSAGAYGTVFEIAGVTTAQPTFSPAPGAYTTAQSVKITTATSGATIYYTLNGSANPIKYTGAISVSASTIISAYATSPTLPRSQSATAGYQIGTVTAAPEFSPAAGTYSIAQSVTITDADPHATIYYAINGTPTTSSTKYTGPIAVKTSETIEAIATASGLTESAVVSADYTITPVTPPGEVVLYSFGASTTDGTVPSAGVIFDSKGNLYGTTTDGGANKKGSVYELSPQSGGGWRETVIYSFGAITNDAVAPNAALVFDSNGNLYGTTAQGGAIGQGTVFELSLSGSTWTENVIWSFGLTTTDGEVPEAGLVFDSKGNLYGTTYQGGANTTWAEGSGGWGTVFELSPPASGTTKWTEKILYAFGYLSQTDGYFPTAGVIFDSKGNLYGTTSDGSSGQDLEGGGSVFKLSPTTSGPWKETVLYSFGGGSPNGYSPEGGLIMDGSGNLYGTAHSGGNGFGLDGNVFEISPAAGGGWTETILHSFGAFETDGTNPTSTLLWDSKGNLYGTTYGGGTYQSGIVYELVPETEGGWTEQVLYNLGATATDAAHPYAGLVFNSAGQLFGTTQYGGKYGSASTGGTVFEIKTSAVVTAPPTVTLTPAKLTFASTSEGVSTAVQVVTLKNTSTTATLTINSGGITFTGADPGSFTKTTTCGTSLTPGGSCTISIAFKPVAVGALTASLSIADNATGSPQTVSLTGTGVAASLITLSSSTLTFPNTVLGAVSEAQIVTVENIGADAATVSSISLGGTNPTDFVQVHTCGTSLAAGASCSVFVAFKPAAAASYSATLSVADNAAGTPQQVTLSGTGVAAATLTLSAASLAFPATTVGTASAAMLVTVTNTGTVTADISSISISGTDPSSFLQINNCASTLAPSASCTVAVAFVPAKTGALAATLNVIGPGITKSVTLSGTGN